MSKPTEKEHFRDTISTVNSSGKRAWLYPKKPKGPYYLKRKAVGYLLVLLLFVGPFIKINGKQLFLFNVIERKFHVFGTPFWTQDFHLLALMMLMAIVFVCLFTVGFGRLFCGWVCPQTVFLELIFRPIEYWIEGDRGAQIKLNKMPWHLTKIKKKLLKWGLFFFLSFLISNIFLAYFIGSDQLLVYSTTPGENLQTLFFLLCFTAVFYFVFAWFREQVCVIACPYGRLQGVLLDKHSIVVAYDNKRGEKEAGRAKFNKKENRVLSQKGDCIDCFQCVHVCPTGIDIRNGTQLECVNCTACMDACDQMMKAVGLPQKLIRYASEHQIETQQKFQFTSRLKGYSFVLLVLIGLFTFMMTTRTLIEATLLRIPGQLYTLNEQDNSIQNVYTFKLINKSDRQFEELEMRLLSHEGKIYLPNQQNIQLQPEVLLDGTFFVELPRSSWKGTKLKLKIGFFNQNELIESASTLFLGPRSYR
ncbi:MAG: cytochrome c oxidase accessory protein CcoG [Flavobacteriaceae bacterium]|jgi:cytochrome c oxidase accessory protein FixG